MSSNTAMPIASSSHIGRVVVDLTADQVGARCLVTGARGFLGRRLVEALVALGCDVIAVDDLRISREETLRVSHKRLDLTVRARVIELLSLQPVDVVFHCDRQTPDRGNESLDDLQAMLHHNVVGTATILASARAASVERMVVLGDVCGCAPDARGADPYVRSMHYVENAVLGASRRGRLETTVVRTGTVWGPGSGYVRGVLERLAAGAAAHSAAVPPPHHLTHLDAAVRALLLAAARLEEAPDSVAGRAISVVDPDVPPPRERLLPILDTLGYRSDGRGWRRLPWHRRWLRRGQPRRAGPVDAESSLHLLGWRPVLAFSTAMAELLIEVHDLHAETVMGGAKTSVPFRAPDAALVAESETSLTAVAWERRPGDRAGREVRLMNGVVPAIEAALLPSSMRIFVDGVHSRVPAPSPFPLGARPVVGVLCLRSAEPDAPACIQKTLSRHGFDSAVYRVAQSVYTDHGDSPHGAARDWADGARSPGVVMVGLLQKPPLMAYDDWRSRWFDEVARVTAEILPRSRYARQRVLEPVTEGAPRLAGLALESFQDIADVRALRRMYRARSPLALVRNMARVLWAVVRVFPVMQIQTIFMSETVIRTDVGRPPDSSA